VRRTDGQLLLHTYIDSSFWKPVVGVTVLCPIVLFGDIHFVMTLMELLSVSCLEVGAYLGICIT
jgi:predicted transporter